MARNRDDSPLRLPGAGGDWDRCCVGVVVSRERIELVIVTPPIASTDIDTDLVNLTEFLHRKLSPGEAYSYGLGGEFGYGYEFENDVFVMFPFYWGDCTCGFDAIHAATEREHSSGCFSSRYMAEEERIRANDMPYDREHDHMTAWAKTNGYAKAPMGMAVHCDCGTREWWEAWSREHDHDSACPTVRHNFVHKVSGLTVDWYKWIGRDMEFSREPSPDEWRAIFAECIRSVA